jgi:hypothetical protein
MEEKFSPKNLNRRYHLEDPDIGGGGGAGGGGSLKVIKIKNLL